MKRIPRSILALLLLSLGVQPGAAATPVAVVLRLKCAAANDCVLTGRGAPQPLKLLMTIADGEVVVVKKAGEFAELGTAGEHMVRVTSANSPYPVHAGGRILPALQNLWSAIAELFDSAKNRRVTGVGRDVGGEDLALCPQATTGKRLLLAAGTRTIVGEIGGAPRPLDVVIADSDSDAVLYRTTSDSAGVFEFPAATLAIGHVVLKATDPHSRVSTWEPVDVVPAAVVPRPPAVLLSFIDDDASRARVASAWLSAQDGGAWALQAIGDAAGTGDASAMAVLSLHCAGG